MKISTKKIREGFNGEKCLVHARMCVTPNGTVISTAQDLTLTGDDFFDGIKLSLNFGEYISQEGLTPITHLDGNIHGICDATPMYHRKTNTVLLLGHNVVYAPAGTSPTHDYRKATFYSVFDGEKFQQHRFLEMPEELDCGNGSGQSWEEENGDILIPVYLKTDASQYGAAVARCHYDGENLTFAEIGNILKLDVERGLYEPSIIKHNGIYHMTLRNDLYGYHSTSTDGLHFEEPTLWCFDDGEVIPTYNTQQHWLTCGGKLYLIYTRKGLDNDHVFRHRAPLVMGEVSNGKVIKNSELLVAPNRGARLGNFGACQVPYDKNRAFIMAAEWMQPIGCEKYGSNNAIWVTEVEA